MTRAEAIDLCKNLKLFMEINDKLYANKFLESYHVALSMATNALSEVSELQAINLDLASENENLLDQIQEMKAKTWIPCKKDLPKDGKEILCHNTRNDYLVAEYIYEDESSDTGYVGESNECFIDDVVAWMPLPEPYKEENEE